ncbi:hypothetical protein SLEP1_g33489 [Rubroshorea leprosula]|uniref:Uncharacterized protein n=1 Tax=Rubroshorea leprosula TaxID=152421 RepID=A0AAV5KGX5_9ROSI|nr:hypothetical protein SLEP1_g33489 [Rubroshorea leprosula]
MEEPRIDAGEAIGDDFYEKIEAPKFVDLTAPDRYRTEDDDRFWFCLRVGCDQKHEEEMDSEAIYKNFVLRVMAARSPNVRFQKVLCRREASTKMKCPQTVPAKPSKSRLSRLAMISSISRTVADAKTKDRPLPKQGSTPNVKAKQPSVLAKALTTPRNKKRLSNPGTFRSVRNTKATTIEVPKNRVVAKALVFHSPKKIVKLKKSVELGTSLRKLCTGMKKLEITNGKKDTLNCNKTLPLDASKRKIRGREVKSRVYDSLHSQSHKCQEAKHYKHLKMRNKEKDSQFPKDPASNQEPESNSDQLEIKEKSRDGSADVCSTSGASKFCEGNKNEEQMSTRETVEPQMNENEVKLLSDTLRGDMTSLSNSEERNTCQGDVAKFQSLNGEDNDNEIIEGSSREDKTKTISKDKEIPEAMKSDHKENENDLASHIINSKAMDIDDKENASAFEENRKSNLTSSTSIKRNVVGKNETSRCTPKVSKEMSKASKESSICFVKNTQGMKYRKPKPTNPKPFRLRTDERGTLKEANLEKKHVLAPLREITTFTGSSGGNSQKKHQNAVQINEIENANCAYESTNDEPSIITPKNPPQISCPRSSKGTLGRKFSSNLLRGTISTQQKTKLVSSQLENGQNKTAQNSDANSKRNKSQGIASSRRKMVSLMKPGQLGTIKETSPTILRPKEASTLVEDGSFLMTKAPASNASGQSPQGRRRATIPKDPNFHSIHFPKSCRRRVT